MLKNRIYVYMLTYYNAIALDRLMACKLESQNNVNINTIYPAKLGIFVSKYPVGFRVFWKVFLLLFPLILVCQITYLFFKSILLSIAHKKVKFKGSRLFLLTDDTLLKTASRINLHNDLDYWLLLPWKENKNIPSKNKLSVFDILSFKNIIVCYLSVFKSIIPVLKRFGYKNTIYLLNAYDWFLYNEALNSINKEVEVFSSNQKDRWAILFDKSIQVKKSVVQHGTNKSRSKPNDIVSKYYLYNQESDSWTLIMPQKMNNISKLYAFTEEEASHIIKGEFKCFPLIEYIGYNITLTPLLKKNTSVLIVGNIVYYKQVEQTLIKGLQNLGIKIYLKSHPLVDKKKYDYLLSKYKFTIVDDNVFPCVDFVLSYDSTLAYEYENLGTKVFYYSKIDINDIQNVINAYIKNSTN